MADDNDDKIVEQVAEMANVTERLRDQAWAIAAIGTGATRKPQPASDDDEDVSTS